MGQPESESNSCVGACYVPTNGKDEELDEFWNEFEDILNDCETAKRIIMIGYMNSEVGVRRDVTGHRTIWRFTWKCNG